MQEAIDEAARCSLKGFVTAQNSWNMLARDIEKDLIPVCEQNNIGLLPYYPIAKGLLTGRYRRGDEPEPGSRMDGANDIELADFEFNQDFEAEDETRSPGWIRYQKRIK